VHSVICNCLVLSRLLIEGDVKLPLHWLYDLVLQCPCQTSC